MATARPRPEPAPAPVPMPMATPVVQARDGLVFARTPAAHALDLCRSVSLWLRDLRPVDTWPHVWHPRASAEICTLRRGTEVLALAAAQRVRLVTPSGTSPVTLLGSVVTAPQHRGCGHARRLLQQVAAAEGAHGQCSLLLWSEQHELWRRLGFLPAGVQHEAVLTLPASAPMARTRLLPAFPAPMQTPTSAPRKRTPSPTPALMPASAPTTVDGQVPPLHLPEGGAGSRIVRLAQANDLPALLDLHDRKPARVIRDLHDLALQLTARPMSTVVMVRDGALAAYACHGKGADFSGWWHEVGGSDEAVAELLPAAMALLGRRQDTLLVPPYRIGLLERLRALVTWRGSGAGALQRVLKPPVLADFFVDGLDAI